MHIQRMDILNLLLKNMLHLSCSKLYMYVYKLNKKVSVIFVRYKEALYKYKAFS